MKTSKGIIISTSKKTAEYLYDLLMTLNTTYPVFLSHEGVTRAEGSFEIGGIKDGIERFDEFVYLHDTVLIKDNSLFDTLFETPGNVFMTEGAYHYMGKFVSNDLKELPEVKNKEEAIHWELRWQNFPYTVMKDPLPVHTDVFETVHGEKRMKLECPTIIKFKGTYRI